MHPTLEEQLERAVFEFGRMPEAKQLEKLDQVLLLYTNGDAHAAEGLKLTYISLVAAQAKIKEVDQIRQTLNLFHKVKIEEQFRKIYNDLAELTALLFPNDQAMACELLREEYRCEPQ